MAENTLERPPIQGPPTETESPERKARSRAWLVGHVWWIVAVALVLFSAGLVYWSRTRPGYDPYGWLGWGYQTLHLSLNLGGAPSWKPLPYLFTVPYALFGHIALRMWMITSVAISLAQALFAGRIAYRVTYSGPKRRYAAIAAAVFAGVAALGIQDYMHYILSAQSDAMIVTLCLAAIDCYLSGRYRWAFALGVMAALGRPEAWPFLGLYSIWAWRSKPQMRWMIYAGLAAIPLLWFGVPTITNHRPLLSGQLAELSPRELHGNKIVGTWDRFTALTYAPIQIAALVALALAIIRRNRVGLMLAGGALGWIVVEMAFALHGWPAVPRYMFEPAGLTIVLAAVAVGWVLTEASRLRHPLLRWAGVPLVLLLVGSLVPGALARARHERTDLRHERERTVEISRLQTTIDRVGGYKHVLYCGRPVTNVGYVSILAWFTNMNTGKVGHRPKFEQHQKYPIVMFTPDPNGWSLRPYHTEASKRAACAGLNVSYVFSPAHPGGVAVRR